MYLTGYVEARERVPMKEAIGRAPAALVEDGASVMLDSGSTVYCVAANLRGRRDLTFVVNDLRTAQLVADDPGVRLLVGGGGLLASNYALVGDRAASFVREPRVDWTFLGADAIDVHTGITNRTRSRCRSSKRCSPSRATPSSSPTARSSAAAHS
jgi:DeoR/GlpR family transcriptional regulator of sugar metabolism